ncbi:MAG TPA: hypothetical protein VHK88_01990 [Aquihabitans sp.]|nr:hypothetical protein [Aquihabitans sp.]
MRRPEDRAAAATTAGVAVVIASLAVLHLLGEGTLAAPPLRSTAALRAWATERGPVEAGIAVIRLVALGIGYHLVITTALGIAGRALRWPGLSRLAEVATVPPLRGTVRRLAGIGLSASAVLMTPVPAASGQAPASTGQALIDDLPGVGPTRARIDGVDHGLGSRPGGADAGRRPSSLRLGPGTATMGRRPTPVPGAGDGRAATADRSGGATMRRTEPEPAVMRRRAEAPSSPVEDEADQAVPTTPAPRTPVRPGGVGPGPTTPPPRPGAPGDPATDEATGAPVDDGIEVPVLTLRHRVRPGDHLWAIAEQRLAAHLGRTPTEAETTVHWRAVVAANPQLIDPDLLLPGDEVDLPPLAPGSTASLRLRPAPRT